MTRRPNTPFYYVFEIPDLFCGEEESNMSKVSKGEEIAMSKMNKMSELFDSGKLNMSVFMGGVTFINVEVIE